MIFVSHAVADAQLAEDFVDLLQSGMELSQSDIFCSSKKGGIPNGEFFVDHILKKLNSSEVVVALISRSYLKSKFCLAEAGIAQARQSDGTGRLYSLLIPPVSFKNLDGVLHGVQAGKICEESSLNELYDAVAGKKKEPSNFTFFERRRGIFLKACVQEIGLQEANALRTKIILQDLGIERSVNPNVTYKYKIRFTFGNDTGKMLTIDNALWNHSVSGIAFIGPEPYLKWEVAKGMKWSEPDTISLKVPPGRSFRTWIGLDESVKDDEVLRRTALRQLGILNATIAIGAQETLFMLNL